MIKGAPYTKVANTNFERQYVDLTVKPGDVYSYQVWAVYEASEHAAYTTVSYPVASPVFEIVSTPPSTVKTGEGYEYRVQMNADPRITTMNSHVEGAPDGVETWFISGIFRVRWDNPETGVYKFMLVVTGIDHTGKTVKATQSITLVVAPRTGAIDIAVKNIAGEPVPFSHIQLMLLPEDIDGTKIRVMTNEEGKCSLNDVPVGDIIAYCYPGDDRYAPRYYHPYTIARTLSEAEPLRLTESPVMYLEFVLQEVGDDRVAVNGTVRDDETGDPVGLAKVHFIRKNNFILIGDWNLRENPALIENWGTSSIDTTLATDANGSYSTLLPVGVEYFMVVEKDGFFESFNPDLYYNTNALEARPFRTEKYQEREFNYRIVAKNTTGADHHSVQGVVRREDNNLNEQATVLLIQRDMKLHRGSGGGATYGLYKGIRSVLTDSNGVYEFKDVPPDQYVLFAIPMNRGVVPQYFATAGTGAMTFENSGLVTVTNTIQGIDFNLHSAVSDGLGTAWGVVQLQVNDNTPERLSGAVVCAIDPFLDRIVGYSISDINGRYAIPNLRPGSYDLVADHPRHGYDLIKSVNLQYTSLENREAREDLTIKIKVSGIEDYDASAVPSSLVLYQNYPNPFNPSTNIKFGIHKRSAVKLTVFNAFGQEVQILEEGKLDPGTYSFQFDASTLASGMYFYRLTAGDKTVTKSMMLVK